MSGNNLKIVHRETHLITFKKTKKIEVRIVIIPFYR